MKVGFESIVEYNFEQRSPEWFEIRKGKVTASNFHILMAPRGLGKSAHTLAKQIIKDEIMAIAEEQFISGPMQWGIDNEPVAIAYYEQEHLIETREVGFYTRNVAIKDSQGMVKVVTVGASPDRMITQDFGVEVKCPQGDKHTSNLMEIECPKEYWDQIQGCMYVTGAIEWEFISFNPNFTEKHKKKEIRVIADSGWQIKFEQRLAEFDDILEQYRAFLN